MPQRDPELSLLQMREHAMEAIALARGRKRADLDTDRTFNLALVRLLEILGEAAGRVPPEDRAKFPNVPWAQVVGLRNHLIHAYDEVDHDIVWEVVSNDLDKLVEELNQGSP